MTAAMKLKDACSFEGSYDKSRQCVKKLRHRFGDGLYSQSNGFSCFGFVMYGFES